MNTEEQKKSLNISELRARLQGKEGKQYWRSLEELAETEEFQHFLENEFSSVPHDGGSELSRRRFLQLMGASIALAGLNACTKQPNEKIIPYVIKPEDIVLGKPLFFATAVTLGGYATGVLAESHEGRPTKIEGNPDHPASLGATDAFAQAAILELYDPDRSRFLKFRNRIGTWDSFLTQMRAELESQRIKDGAGIRILTGTITSPTLAAQIQGFLKEFPLAKWHQYEAIGRDNVKEGSQLAFGDFVETRYDFSKADRIFSLDSDFLGQMPGSLAYTRQFAAKRKAEHDDAEMNRLYSVGCMPTSVSAVADHHLPLKASGVLAFAAGVARKLGVNVQSSIQSDQEHGAWIDAIASDLRQHAGKSVVVPGDQQPAAVHYLAHAINAALNNVGSTVLYSNSVEAKPEIQIESIKQLATDMDAGTVDLLFVLGGNPVYDAPGDLDFASKMSKVKTRVHLGLHQDETATLCHWHIPQSHSLECWSDARTFDGTATIIQPLIAPLYATKSVHEVVAALADDAGRSAYDMVRETWRGQRDDIAFERYWQTSVHDGVLAGTAFSTRSVSLRQGVTLKTEAASGDLEVVFRPDPHIWDGKFANNGWLQELPKPISLITWDNAAFMSPATAQKLDVENEQVVEIKLGERSVSAPVWIVPGHASEAVTIYLGYGRRQAGSLGSNCGFDANMIRSTDHLWIADNAEITRTDDRVKIACVQSHSSMEGRHLVRYATTEEYHNHPEMFHEMGHDPGPEMSLYPAYEYDGYAWGMVIDLNTCTGCGACTIACQSENNIPVVGKEEVINGREMHWIRVDRYFEGDLDHPDVHHQPVPCMHCENAPCEVVCPVEATTHSAEGLNEMTYNRCVGTRYCSNNCPYKVRRFNFYKYADFETESLKLMRNPDVTVRFRGVMEKCTYCVQRINHARIDAEKEGRKIQDGEIKTACQQVCPADAITFGDINDPNSKVAKQKADHRNYGLLTNVGTRPRTTYLAKLKNPNPEIRES